MSLTTEVIVKNPTFTNKVLNVEVKVSGIAGPPGPTLIPSLDLGSFSITGVDSIDIDDDLNPIPSNTIAAFVQLNSSNATETIKTLVDMPAGIPIRFHAAASLIITFEHAVGTNKPRCLGGINNSINGDYNEWIEFTKIDGKVLQTNIGKYSFS